MGNTLLAGNGLMPGLALSPRTHAVHAHTDPGRASPDGHAAPVVGDRRRPGRREVEPALVPLLRGQAPDPGPNGPDAWMFRPVDDLAAAVGIARGVGAMCLVWAGAALIILH